MHFFDAVPVSARARPSLWVTGAGSGAELLSGPQVVDVAAGVAVCWGYEADRAVQVVLVVPGHERLLSTLGFRRPVECEIVKQA